MVTRKSWPKVDMLEGVWSVWLVVKRRMIHASHRWKKNFTARSKRRAARRAMTGGNLPTGKRVSGGRGQLSHVRCVRKMHDARARCDSTMCGRMGTHNGWRAGHGARDTYEVTHTSGHVIQTTFLALVLPARWPALQSPRAPSGSPFPVRRCVFAYCVSAYCAPRRPVSDGQIGTIT